MSSTESESPIARPAPKRDGRQRLRNDRGVGVVNDDFDVDFDDDDESHIEAEIRRLPPPKSRRTDKTPATGVDVINLGFFVADAPTNKLERLIPTTKSNICE